MPLRLPPLPSSASGPTPVARSKSWLTRMLAAAGLVVAAAAHSQSGPSCVPDQAGNPADCPAPAPAAIADHGPGRGAGNPIDVVTGNKYQLETDLPPLPGALGLEIRRHYNSQDAHAGALGTGWRLGYEVELHEHGTGLMIVQADGRRIVLRCASGTPRRCAAARRTDGSVRVDTTEGTTRYRWLWPDGRELEFRGSGDDPRPLRRIRLADGATLTITHDTHGRPVRVRDPQGRTLHLAYAPGTHDARRIARIITPVGQWTYGYDAHGRLASVTPPDEPVAVDDAGRALPAGTTRRVVRQYDYAAAPASPPGALLAGIRVASQWRDPGGQEVAAQRARTEDAVRIASWSYDELGRAVASEGFAGAGRVRLAFLPDARTRLTNAQGAETVYRHAAVAGIRRIVEAVGPGCPTCPSGNRRYEYGRDGTLRGITLLADDGSAIGHTRAHRDALGRVVLVTRHPGGDRDKTLAEPLLRIAYHGSSDLPARIARPSVVPGREHAIALSFKENGQLQQVTESGFAPAPAPAALTRTLRLSYDAERRLVAVDGPLAGDADTLHYAYDGAGRIVRITSPAGAVSRIGYDAAGRVARVIPAGGEAIEYARTALGMVHTARRAGKVIALRRDAYGRVREMLRDGIPEKLLVHDPAGRLRFAASAGFALEAFDHDAAGNPIGQTRWTHRATASDRQEFDGAGRLLRHFATDGGVTSIEYNGRRLPELLRDPAGIVTAIAYDDRLQARVRIDAANTALPAVLTMTHDPHGQLATLRAPDGGRYTTVRDDFGRVVATMHPDAGTTRFLHDEADRLIGRIDADGTLHSYRYDEAGHLVERATTAPGGAPARVTLHYQRGRVAAIDDGAQTEERGFDEQGRVVAITRRFHGARPATVTESFSYTADGQLATRTLADGSVLRARRNTAGRMVALDWIAAPGRAALPLLADIGQDGLGVHAWTYGNGVRFRAERDAATGRITALRHDTPAGASLLHIALRYDALGNVASERTNGQAAVHGYDAHRRLVVSGADGAVHRYAYGAGGRRLASLAAPAAVSPAPKHEADHDAARFPATPPTRFDAAGRMLADARHRYLWNAEGRLAEVRGLDDAAGTAPIARYAYNARGERVAVQARGADRPTYFLHHGGRVSAELDADGRVRRHYIYLDGVPVATIDREHASARYPAGRLETRARIRFLHANHLRAPQLATDEQGRAVWRAAYGPFGEPPNLAATPSEASAPAARDAGYRQPLAFAGQVRDESTGLHYNVQRYYDPRSGQYLSPDPLGPAATLAAYAYVDANPRSALDPLGLILFAFDGTGNGPESRTNISWLVEHYRDNDPGVIGASLPFYEPGPGSAWWAAGDAAIAYTLSAAVTRQLGRLDDYLLASVARSGTLTAASLTAPRPVIDIVGFSRGAAAARSFANQVAARARDGYYLRLLQGRCVDVQLRFMGLFDTVLSFATGSFELGIPSALAVAAHAVAVNEHRTLFPLESIEPDFAAIGSAPRRVELGFVGSHSDVGGGYACVRGCDGGDLSDVALNWMSEQARRAGVTLAALAPSLRTVSQPLLHTEIHGLPFSAWGIDQDRSVRYPGAANAPMTPPAQRVAPIAGLDTTASGAFVTPAPDPARSLAGTVDMASYRAWLAANYGIVLAP